MEHEHRKGGIVNGRSERVEDARHVLEGHRRSQPRARSTAVEDEDDERRDGENDEGTDAHATTVESQIRSLRAEWWIGDPSRRVFSRSSRWPSRLLDVSSSHLFLQIV